MRFPAVIRSKPPLAPSAMSPGNHWDEIAGEYEPESVHFFVADELKDQPA